MPKGKMRVVLSSSQEKRAKQLEDIEAFEKKGYELEIIDGEEKSPGEIDSIKELTDELLSLKAGAVLSKKNKSKIKAAIAGMKTATSALEELIKAGMPEGETEEEDEEKSKSESNESQTDEEDYLSLISEKDLKDLKI